MSVLERAYEVARGRQARVVLPEIDEPRMAEAAALMEARGVAQPVHLPTAAPREEEVAAVLARRPKMKPQIAGRMLDKPLFRAGAMLATGAADVMVAGAASPTRRVIEAASMTVGLGDGILVPSSFFLMLLPDGREMVFADCAVNAAPEAEELAAIALASARSADALLGAARVAMLSFSTGTSGTGASVDMMRMAAGEVAAAGASVVGPVQADAALNPQIAELKGLRGGDANTLIFPSLDAGNIAYKLMQELAGARAIGPILQGFARPVCDLSRGATVEDILAATVVSIAMG